MELQKQFSQEYLSTLKRQVYDPEYRKKYEGDSFSIEDNENNVVKIGGLYNKHVNLKVTEYPKSKNDLKNAITFFEAYKDMSPLVAAQEAFWAYLTHVEYYDYVKERWDINSETSANNIILRFFVNGTLKLTRNALGHLWWTVYITYDEENKDPYHLTRILFTNTEVVQDMTESQFFSVRPLTRGVLEFFEEHTDIKPTKINIKKIMSYFNSLGGVRELSFETEDSIKKIIEKEIEFK